LITIFLILDIICTIWAVSSYKKRVIDVYYNKDLQNKYTIINKIEYTLFSNEKMLETFPNIRFINEQNEEVWIKDIIKENK
ncbi:MAG: hypothetical protein HFJ20_01180, partial [Clostridia bacterium]|nr:hypothetical protein [Clostridia bacterium]